MTGVQHIVIGDDDSGQRLDRWFRRRFPDVKQGQIEKLLRTGQVRVDGRRAKASHRLTVGEAVRVPPLPDAPSNAPPVPAVRAEDAAWLKSRILYEDGDVIVIDKPSGLAVQGGSKTHRHLDGLLDALRTPGGERPRLVHRLDKDTSGVLVLARSRRTAARLAESFRDKSAEKVYWAVVVGVPDPDAGVVEDRLAKTGASGKARVTSSGAGRRAVTRYIVRAHTDEFAWLEMRPITGRTHQLRAHAEIMGTPILGDGKYGGRRAFAAHPDMPRTLHLHARSIRIPHPGNGTIDATAPLPDHMAETFEILGFKP